MHSNIDKDDQRPVKLQMGCWTVVFDCTIMRNIPDDSIFSMSSYFE